MADFPKKQQQCLIPKYLLEYATDLQENHPDPTAEWGGSGVADIEAGTGIEITGETTKTISLDTTPDTFEVTASTGTTIEVENENPLYKDAKLQMTNAGATRLEGTQISLEANNIYLNSDNAPYYVNNTTHEYKTLATTDQLFSGDYNDLYNKPTIPTKTSELNNDSGFITNSVNNLTNYYDKTTIDGKVENIDEDIALKANAADISTVGYSGSYNDLSNKPDLSVYELKEDAFSGDYEDLTNKPDLSVYELKSEAFSGDYNDLTNKPSIPTKTSDLTNDSGYITGVTWSDVTGKPTFAQVATTGDYDDLTDKPDLSVYELKSEAFSGSYNDLTDKPTIPTVGNGTITIKKNNTTVDTFTTNQSTNKSINITVPTDTADLTNGAGFITAAQVPDGLEVIEITIPYPAMSYTLTAAELAKVQNGCIILYHRYVDPQGTTDLGSYSYPRGNFALYQEYIYDDIPYWNASYGNVGPSMVSKGLTITSAGVVTYRYDSNTQLAKVAATGSYNDLSNKPTIPSVGNGTITIQKNGTAVDTFTTNQSSSKSINITVPTAVSDLTNDSGFITGITSSDVTTALGYTPGTSNFSGDYADLTGKPDLSIYAESANLATVATTGAYSDLSGTPTIPTVNDNTITITQGGVTKGSFTLNQNTNATIDVDDVPGMIGEVIYDQPAGEAQATSLTMAHSFADYEYVDIQYRIYDSQYFVGTQRIYEPNGKMISLDWKFNTDWANANVYGKCARYTLNGNTMTVNSDTGYEYYNNTMGSVTQNTYQYQILITKVIGYKQNSAPIVIPHAPTYTVLYNVTPTNGTVGYNVTLSDAITNYDEIRVFYNDNDNVYNIASATFQAKIGGHLRMEIINYGTSRWYSKVTQYDITDAYTLTLAGMCQFRGGNNEATQYGYVDGSANARPYKVVGIKY